MHLVFQTCKTVYDRIIDLRIATPQIIMNYGLFLEENNYFEEAFKVRNVHMPIDNFFCGGGGVKIVNISSSISLNICFGFSKESSH